MVDNFTSIFCLFFCFFFQCFLSTFNSQVEFDRRQQQRSHRYFCMAICLFLRNQKRLLVVQKRPCRSLIQEHAPLGAKITQQNMRQ